MKVSEITSRYSLRRLTQQSGTRRLLFQLTCFGCGFIAAGGKIFGTYSPFGVSVIAAVPFKGAFSSLLGAVSGYLTFGGYSGSFRYMASMLAVLAIRWTLNDIRQLNRHSMYTAAVCFVPTLATGLASMSVSGFRPDSALTFTLEALLGGAAAYFFSRTMIIINGTRSLGALLPTEVACLVLSGCIGLLALSGVMIGPVSLGRTAAILCILIAARYGGAAGGAAAGISAGILLGIAVPGHFFIGSAYAFGGLLAGIFSQTGRLPSAISFTLSCAVVSLQSGEPSTVIASVYECVAGGAVFLFLPATAGNFISAVFVPTRSDEQCQSLRDSVIMRLDFASKALSDVSTDVEEVAEKLSGLVTPTLDSVYEKAVDMTCQRCGLKVYCWEHRDGVTMESFQSLNDILKNRGSIKPDEFREDFRRKCCRTAEMAQAVNKAYRDHLASEAASKRIDEIRSVVAGQFCGLGDMLSELADEYENYEYFDSELSDRLTMKYKELGLVPTNISCRIDTHGRMTVEAEIYDTDRKKLNRALIVRETDKLCGRHFDPPSVTAAFGRCRIVMCERPAFDIEIASSQHVCNSGVLCGDHFRYFNDGMGRMVAILSDGMGTGGRAAVDGGMAVSLMTKLIKAGLGFDCSLKVVNSALLVKSEDESLATVDLISVDLYSGHTDYMKAGAAVSFLRKNGDMYRIETPSLPVGILPDAEFTVTEDTLSPDDIIVMVSDGAVFTGDEWIEHIIIKWGDKSMQELAHLINDEATARRSDGHDDDITVIAMRCRQAAGA